MSLTKEWWWRDVQEEEEKQVKVIEGEVLKEESW